MSNDSEKWQWVDEDPIEKLLHVSKAGEEHAPAPSPAEALIAAGRTQFEQLRFEEAAGSFSAAVAAAPDHPTAHFDLAVCLEKLEQWKAAANSFQRAIEIDPGRVQALIGLGACLLHLEGAEQALACFEQCLLLGVESEPALLGKAVALQQLARFQDADRAYRELLQSNPGAAEPLANLIALSVARQDTVAIAEYSRRLLRVHPQSKAALQGLAMLAIRNGDQPAAIEFCKRLVEIDPDTFEGWFNLRFAQQRMLPPEQPARSIA
jgi:tetratricopeptide (TPR) repeat protein